MKVLPQSEEIHQPEASPIIQLFFTLQIKGSDNRLPKCAQEIFSWQ